MKNTNKLTNIANALIVNSTIANASTRRLSTKNGIALEDFVKWDNAIKALHEHGYKGHCAILNKGEDKDLETHKNELYNATKEILAMLGTVNGYKWKVSENLALTLAGFSFKKTTELLGDAFTKKSELNNARKELRKMQNGNGEKLNGINEQAYAEKSELVEKLNKELKALKKEENSGAVGYDYVKYEKFKTDVEDYLAAMVKTMSLKSYEEIQEEIEKEKQRRKEEKARKKAEKKAELEKAQAQA